MNPSDLFRIFDAQISNLKDFLGAKTRSSHWRFADWPRSAIFMQGHASYPHFPQFALITYK
jgi:hypothetical protein